MTLAITLMILLFIRTQLHGRTWPMESDLSLNLDSATYWLSDLGQLHRLLEGTTR